MKRSKLVFWAFVTPALIMYVVFMLYPLMSSLVLSLFSWTGYGSKTFVGLSNFIRLFSLPAYSERFFGALKNTFLFFIYTIILQNFIALLLAAFLNIKRIRGARFFRNMYYIPSTLSIVIVGFIWVQIYNPLWGTLNFGLKAIGFKNVVIPWLGLESTALLCIAIANAWQYAGIPIMFFTAGMQSIPEELYEAAAIDGATGIQQFWKITVPLITPVMFVMTTIVFVSIFTSFEIIYAMAGTLGAPNYSTDVLGTFFYRICFGQRLGVQPDMGLGAAIATCMFVLVGIAVYLWLRFYGSKNNSY